jgi:hypothetical protein
MVISRFQKSIRLCTATSTPGNCTPRSDYLSDPAKFAKNVNFPTERSQERCTPWSPKKPSDLVAVDYYGPLPESLSQVSYIFAVIDSFSKFVKLYPLCRAQAKLSAQRVLDFHRTVPTKVVLSDHGTQFQSKQWQETLEQWDIQPTFSTVRQPQSNPTERVMRELSRLFRTYCQDADANWATVLSKIELLFNITSYISTGYSSYEILLGKNPTNRLSKLLGPLLPAVPLQPVDQIHADLVKFYHRRA